MTYGKVGTGSALRPAFDFVEKNTTRIKTADARWNKDTRPNPLGLARPLHASSSPGQWKYAHAVVGAVHQERTKQSVQLYSGVPSIVRVI